jgi:hypothetical protein
MGARGAKRHPSGNTLKKDTQKDIEKIRHPQNLGQPVLAWEREARLKK